MKTLILFILLAIPIYSQLTERDTLTAGTDSISVFNQQIIFEQIEVTVKDTTTDGDTLYIERYDPKDLTWHRIGAYNTFTGVIDPILAPGAATTRTWIVNDSKEYASYVRVRRVDYPKGTAIKTMITWTGKH